MNAGRKIRASKDNLGGVQDRAAPLRRRRRARSLVPLAVVALAVAGVGPTVAQAGKARAGYRISSHLFALDAPSGVSGAQLRAITSASQRRHLPDPAFAGYVTNQTGVTTVTVRFKIPTLVCTKAESAIGPGAFLLTGPRDRLLFNAANVIFGCYKGQATAQETLVVNGAESDYARSVQPGDTISVRLTDNPTGHTTAQLSDLTRRYTLVKSGRPAAPDSQLVGDWGSIDAHTQAQLPPPGFQPTTFRAVSVNGQPVGSRSPLGYNMETSHRVVQIVARPISGPRHDSFTCTRVGALP